MAPDIISRSDVAELLGGIGKALVVTAARAVAGKNRDAGASIGILDRAGRRMGDQAAGSRRDTGAAQVAPIGQDDQSDSHGDQQRKQCHCDGN